MPQPPSPLPHLNSKRTYLTHQSEFKFKSIHSMYMKLNKINSLTILAQYYKNESKWKKTNVLLSQTNIMSQIFWPKKLQIRYFDE